MQEADAEINVVGVEFRGAVGGLDVDERFVKLGRAVMLGFMLQDANFRRECTYNSCYSRSLFHLLKA